MSNSIRALQIVGMAQPGNGRGQIINNFRVIFKSLLSYRANDCLSGLSEAGQLRLKKLELLLRKCLTNPEKLIADQPLFLEDFNFGLFKRRIKEIFFLSRDLDVTRGVSIEPILEGGRFLLITTADKVEYEAGARDGYVIIERHSSGMLSYTIKGQAKLRAPVVVKEKKAECPVFVPEEILVMHKAGEMPPLGSLIQLPGGEFEAGNPFEEGGDDEKPVHRVKIYPFLISPYSVTNAEFRRFLEDDGYRRDRFWSEEGKRLREERHWVQPSCWRVPRFNQPNQPVVGVSWYEAEAYFSWLTEETGEEYQFPTEHEWEYAARGELRGKRFPWGNEDPAGRARYRLKPFSEQRTADPPVAVDTKEFAPNRFGLYHMAGNVWEWTLDYYASNYYQALARAGIVANPKGPESGKFRVARGGSWIDHHTAEDLRVARRAGRLPCRQDSYNGFRAARTLYKSL